METRFRCHIAERAVAAVAHQEVGRTILRIVIGRGIPVLACALVEGVEAEIDVEPSIAIVVSDGRPSEGSLRRVGKVKCVWPFPEFATALIDKQQGAIRADHDHVLAPVIIEVGEQGAGGVFQNTEAGMLGDVFKRAVAAIAIETVGKPRRLADIEVIESVVVDVSNRDSVVAVDVDARRAVEYGSPVIGTVQELVRVRRIAAQRR